MSYHRIVNSRIAPLCWIAIGAVAIGAGAGSLRAADTADLWTLRPYAIKVVLVGDTHSLPASDILAAVAKHIETRSTAVVGPLWKLTLTTPTGAQRASVLAALDEQSIQQLSPVKAESRSDDTDSGGQDTGEQTDSQDKLDRPFEPAIGVGFDKLVLIRVVESLTGFQVEGFEYDLYLRRQGPHRQQTAATAFGVPERAFHLLCDLFSPVALFTIDRANPEDATLLLRGSELSTPAGSPTWFGEGDVFLPMLRTTDREGNVPVGGVRAAPWTLLQVAAKSGDTDTPTASIVSHTRRPFGARRRGRVEQIAIRLPVVTDSTRLRLHARADVDRPLPGYHVFVRDTPDAELEELGATDEQGVITIPRTEAAIRTLFVKSGTKLVAKLPIAPGTEAELAAALVDESKRIEAEAKLSLLREELIDLVARRNIFLSRARAAVKAGDLAQARELFSKLEALPSLNVFNQRLTEQQQLSRSRNPAVQARIDKLFEDTRVVLSSFLSSRDIIRLRREINEAAKQGNDQE